MHRLVELHALVVGDGAERRSRDIAGQDDDGDLPTELPLDLLGGFESVHPVGEVVIRQDQIGADAFLRDHPRRRNAVGGGRDTVALARQGQRQELTDLRIVLDDEDPAHVPTMRIRDAVHRDQTRGDVVREGDVDGEDRSPSGDGADTDAVPEQLPKTLHDRKAEPQTEAAFPRRISELMVLGEDGLEVALGDT